ncbi:MAG: hypothetical protein AB7O62_04075 [Pirellulales bacterium]
MLARGNQHWSRYSVLAAVLLLFGQKPCNAGLLDAVRGEVREEHSGSNAPKKPRGSSSSYCDGSDDASDTIGWICLYTVASPFLVPRALLQDEGGEAFFPRFPFDGHRGHLAVESPERDHVKLWGLRLSGEYASNLSDVERLTGKALLSMPFRLGIDTQWNYLHEQLPTGRTDDLWTGDFNLVYRFAQADWAEFRAGAGLNWFADRMGDRYGFNFTYGWDLTCLRPFIWSTEFDIGSLGDALLFHGRTTIGVEYRHVELFVGYDYTSYESAHLHGLISGLRLWF